jgi:hypothetical protein
MGRSYEITGFHHGSVDLSGQIPIANIATIHFSIESRAAHLADVIGRTRRLHVVHVVHGVHGVHEVHGVHGVHGVQRLGVSHGRDGAVPATSHRALGAPLRDHRIPSRDRRLALCLQLRIAPMGRSY